ncbi:MAG: ATP-binding protein [Acetobacteraceae bacterium]|jgi:AAA+ superfamily predicted ATPase|nr:ATP-binding protein [Acetobacteraceae bacterium]
MDAGEQKVIIGYAQAALADLPRKSRRAGALASWVSSFEDALGLSTRAGRSNRAAQEDLFSGESREADAALLKRISDRLARRATALSRQPRSALSARLETLSAAAGLDAAETAILGLVLRYRVHRAVERLFDLLSDAMGGEMRLTADVSLIALLLGLPTSVVERRLGPGAPLRTAGLVAVEPDGGLRVLERLRRRLGDPLDIPPASARAAAAGLLGPSLAPSLGMAEFSHLGPSVAHAAELLAAALRTRRPGTHVLLYGPPGTGKTEFCKTLAAHVGVPLFAVAEADEEGNEPGRTERLAEMRFAQALLGAGTPALLMFDEAEDLFDGGFGGLFGAERSRAHLLRLLETTPVPMLWTTNSVEALGPAVVRRMTFALEMRVPEAAVRTALWTRELARSGIAMESREIERLAREIPAAPAIAASAVAAAAMTGGGAEAVRLGALSVARAMCGGAMPAVEPAAEQDFDPTLTVADHDLATLTERLARPGAPRAVSLLLSGPPGTGKSAFARHLAARLGLRPMQKRASDLLSRFVGGSEKAIAAAFTEAREQGGFLILDEADGLLADRRAATQGWEVTQVNELLTWMEQHPLPFACTTNLPDRLDPACQRRFLVKIGFSALDQGRAALAWLRFFGRPAPAALRSLPPLVPADFALAARKARLMGTEGEDDALLALLRQETMARGAPEPIGFRLAG